MIIQKVLTKSTIKNQQKYQPKDYQKHKRKNTNQKSY